MQIWKWTKRKYVPPTLFHMLFVSVLTFYLSIYLILSHTYGKSYVSPCVSPIFNQTSLSLRLSPPPSDIPVFIYTCTHNEICFLPLLSFISRYKNDLHISFPLPPKIIFFYEIIHWLFPFKPKQVTTLSSAVAGLLPW